MDRVERRAGIVQYRCDDAQFSYLGTLVGDRDLFRDMTAIGKGVSTRSSRGNIQSNGGFTAARIVGNDGDRGGGEVRGSTPVLMEMPFRRGRAHPV